MCKEKFEESLNYAVSIYRNREHQNHFSVAGTFSPWFSLKMVPEVESALSDEDLATLLPKFISERVDVSVILAASELDLMCLVISTIGDRCRLRDAYRRYYNI